MHVARLSRASVLLFALATTRTHAQTRTVAPPLTRAPWSVTDDAFADLWFHCLAVVGYDGTGEYPLYDRAYATRARRVSTDANTALSRRSTELRQTFERDTVFEALHFLPLYYAGRAPETVLADLRSAAQGDARKAGGIIDAAFPLAREKAALLALVTAADEEWRLIVRDERARSLGERSAAATARIGTWQRDFVPALHGYLDSIRVRRGTIVVSPALGREGRFMRRADGSAIILVGSAAEGDTLTPLLAAVRELAFPLAHAAIDASVASRDRVAAERASDIAATRAGALLLDTVAPALAASYRAFYGSSGPATSPHR